MTDLVNLGYNGGGAKLRVVFCGEWFEELQGDGREWRRLGPLTPRGYRLLLERLGVSREFEMGVICVLPSESVRHLPPKALKRAVRRADTTLKQIQVALADEFKPQRETTVAA